MLGREGLVHGGRAIGLGLATLVELSAALGRSTASLSEGLFVHELDARATRKVESFVASAARRPP